MTSSAQLARVEEVTPLRMFTAQNDDDSVPAMVAWSKKTDSLYCDGCGKYDDCFHSARVRLSGILSNSVVKDVKDWKHTQRATEATTAAGEK